MPRRNRVEEILSNVVVTEKGCHEYQGWRNEKGYGRVTIGRRPQYVHRLSAAHHAGRELGPDEVVLHTCDNPCCCNPAHLMIGTTHENVRDMMDKGRKTLVRKRNRLTEAQVLRIKLALAMGHGVSKIAERTGIPVRTLLHIRKGDTWPHVKLGDKPLADPFAENGLQPVLGGLA